MGTKTLFQKLDLTINSNDRIGMVGHNGSGKSTLVRCFSRLHEITGGTIEVEGQDIMSLSEKS